MDDEHILNIFFTGKSNRLIRNYQDMIDENDDIKEYLDNRFVDSLSYKETLIRVKYKIEKRPVCIFCGNPVEFCGCKDKLYREYCSIECKNKSSKVVEKRKQTTYEKYGIDNYAKLNESTEKSRISCIKKYGRPFPYNHLKSKATKLERYSDENFSNREKSKMTSLAKYGVKHYTNPEKAKQTNLAKYGVITYLQHPIARERRKSIESLNKEYDTKRKNKTFNSSSDEDKTYLILSSKYKNIIRNYKSDKYPFSCDFYIPSIDTYIECNYHWTHGSKPYDEADTYCINLVDIWKNKKGKYYMNAVNTWTVRDVIKRNIAKENNLNYLEFFNISEFNMWFDSI